MKTKMIALAVAATLSVGLVNAQETKKTEAKISETKAISNYADFLKANPSIKKFEKHPDFKFEDAADVKKLGNLGYFLDTETEVTGEYQFYRYVKNDLTFKGVDVRGKNIIVKKDINKITGFLAEFEGAEVKDKLVATITKEFGKPVEEIQQNTDMVLAWGFVSNKGKVEDRNKVVPIVITYNIYTGMGAFIWGSPASFFNR